MNRTAISSGRLARAGLALIFTIILCTLVGLGWLQPSVADAETLTATPTTAITPTSPAQNSIAQYVIMSRITVSSTGAGDGLVTLSSITIANPGTANLQAGRVFISTKGTATTMPSDGVEIGKTKGLWTAGTTTTILFTGGTSTQRSVSTNTPKYLYIAFDMASAGTTQASVSFIGVANGADTPASGLTSLSNSVNVAASGIFAQVTQCTDCHGMSMMDNTVRTAATGSFVGSHNKHVDSKSYDCVACHVKPNTTPPLTDHRTGYIQMAATFSFNTTTGNYYSKASAPTYSFLQSSTATSATMGTCSNIYCHSNALGTGSTTPKWASGPLPVTCTGCHGGNAQTSTPMSTTEHSSHVNSIDRTGRTFACGECHAATVTTTSDRVITTEANHVNGRANIKFTQTNPGYINYDSDLPTYNGLSTTVASGASVTPGGPYGKCNNVYCHSIGNLSGTTLASVPGLSTFNTPTWAVSSIGCSGCHGNVPTSRSHPTYTTGSAGSTTANSHVKHVESSGKGCAYCHVNTMGTNTSTAPMAFSSGATTWHLNRVEDVSFMLIQSSTGTYNSIAKTCYSTYCHGAGPSVPWGGSVSCPSCHPALSGAHSSHIFTTANASYGSLTSNQSGTTLVYDFGCGNCHPTTTSNHVNGTTELDIARGASGLKLLNAVTTTVTGTGLNTRCNGVYCHSNGKGTYTLTPTWGSLFSTYNTCGNCHGNWPTGDAHVAHAVGIHYDDVYSGVNGKIPATGSTGSVGHGLAAQGTTINCNICHFATVTKSRNKYGSQCLTCHTVDADTPTTVIMTADLNKLNHIDGNKDVVFTNTTITSRAQLRGLTVTELSNNWSRPNGYKTGTASADVSLTALNTSPAYSTVVKNCTVACHNGNIINWTTTIACNSCHTALP